MSVLDARIIVADRAHRRAATAANTAADELADLLTQRVARRIQAAYSGADELRVDTDNNLGVVYRGEEILADNETDPSYEDAAELVRDDLLRLAELGRVGVLARNLSLGTAVREVA